MRDVNCSIPRQHATFMWLYVISVGVGRQPCYICTLVFCVGVALICSAYPDTCVLWPSCRMDEARTRCLVDQEAR